MTRGGLLTPRRPPRRGARIAALGVAGTAAAFACAEQQPPAPPEPPPAGLVLEIDGIKIHESDVEPLLRYVDGVDRRAGKLTKLGGIIDNFLIPLELARRAWPKERAALRERAEALRRAVGNEGYPGLVLRGRADAGEPDEAFRTRNDFPLPIAAWVFDDANIGQVSPVIETPQGFAVASTYHIDRGTTRLVDRAQVYQVSFFTHGPEEFAQWIETARAQVAGKVQYVHPDYRGALPPWLR